MLISEILHSFKIILDHFQKMVLKSSELSGEKDLQIEFLNFPIAILSISTNYDKTTGSIWTTYISAKMAQALLSSIFKSFRNRFMKLWEADKMVWKMAAPLIMHRNGIFHDTAVVKNSAFYRALTVQAGISYGKLWKKSHQNYYPLLIKCRITSLKSCQILEIMLLFKIRRKIAFSSEEKPR